MKGVDATTTNSLKNTWVQNRRPRVCQGLNLEIRAWNFASYRREHAPYRLYVMCLRFI